MGSGLPQIAVYRRAEGNRAEERDRAGDGAADRALSRPHPRAPLRFSSGVMRMRTHFLILTAALALIAFDSADGQPPATQPPPAAAGGQAAASQTPPAADGQAAQATAPDAPADQTSSPSESPGVVEHNKVIINAQRDQLVGQLTDFDLADPARGLARWHDPVCPLVSGLPQKHGEYILERVSEIAKAAGVPLAGRFCHPNLFILIINQAQAVVEDLRKRH